MAHMAHVFLCASVHLLCVLLFLTEIPFNYLKIGILMPLSYLLSMALSQCFIFLKNGHMIAVLGGLALHAVTVFAVILVPRCCFLFCPPPLQNFCFM